MTTHALAQLIDEVKAANNWSDPNLVSRAAKQGHTLTKSNISRYRNENPLVSIKGEVIQALAAALGVSIGQVAAAALQSMGITVPAYETPSPEQAVRLDPELPARDKEMLIKLIEQMRQSPTATREPIALGVYEIDEASRQSDYDLAANRKLAAPSEGEHIHADIDQAGEESQIDPFDDD